MNRPTTLIALAVLAVFQATPSLIAQQFGYKADVPFSFSVENQTLPAGQYRLIRHGAFLQIANGSSAVYAITITGEASQDGRSKLVFDHVGGAFFLRKLVTDSSNSSIEITRSRAEKRALAELRLNAANQPDTRTIDLSTGGR